MSPQATAIGTQPPAGSIHRPWLTPTPGMHDQPSLVSLQPFPSCPRTHPLSLSLPPPSLFPPLLISIRPGVVGMRQDSARGRGGRGGRPRGFCCPRAAGRFQPTRRHLSGGMMCSDASAASCRPKLDVHCPASHASSSLSLAANSPMRLLARYQKPPHSRGEAGVSMREKKAGGSAGTGRPSARSRQSVLIRAESNKQTYSFSAKE